MTVEIGHEAPDFTLYDQQRRPVTLSEFRGEKAVLLTFYPFAFSRVCTSELCTIRDELPDFVNDEVQVMAVSVDSAFTNRAFAEQEGYEFPLLADFWPHGGVAKQCGVFDERVGCAVRGSFLIDRRGLLRWRVVNGIPDGRSTDDYREAIAGIH